MPTMKISTKCMVFSAYNIASAFAFYSSRPQNHQHFTRLKIRKSADPHFTGGHRRQI